MSQRSQDALIQEIERTWNLIRGRMLGYLESLGLPAEQQAGAKSTFRALSSDAQDRLVRLVADDALRAAIASTNEGITAMGQLASAVKGRLDDDPDPAEAEHLEYAFALIDGRISELREQREDLHHLEQLQRRIGGRS